AAQVIAAQRPRVAYAELAWQVSVDLAAKRWRLVHQQAPKACPAGLDGRGDSRRATADDDERPHRWRLARAAHDASLQPTIDHSSVPCDVSTRIPSRTGV